jgi:alpha-L-fucosidase 2
MKWHDGALTQAEIYSKIGGQLRLRSYVPLQGAGLVPAQGECSNELLAPASIREPLMSDELKDFKTLPVRKVYEYDIMTAPGKTYYIKH